MYKRNVVCDAYMHVCIVCRFTHYQGHSVSVQEVLQLTLDFASEQSSAVRGEVVVRGGGERWRRLQRRGERGGDRGEVSPHVTGTRASLHLSRGESHAGAVLEAVGD